MDWMQLLMSLAPMLGQLGSSAGGAQGGQQNILAQLGPLLQKLMAGLSASGAGQYGTQELQNLQQLFQQQQNAARIGMNPAALARRTVAGTVPINKALAYNTEQAADAATAGNGMAQSPGAVAAGRTAALAPYEEQNLQMGQQNAQFGFPYQFATQSPDYLSVLSQLQQYGSNAAFSLPSGAPGAAP